MAKLTKQKYATLKGEQKINCYILHIPKVIVDQTELADSEIKIYAKDGKIIIEKA